MNPRCVRALVVDDCLPVRAMLSVYLRKAFGVIVSEASTVSEAWKLLQDGVLKFDLLLVDYEIGNHNGLDFLEQAWQLHPDLGAVMVTGSPEDARRDASARHLNLPVVGKPFTLACLRDVMVTILPRLAEEEVGTQLAAREAAGGF